MTDSLLPHTTTHTALFPAARPVHNLVLRMLDVLEADGDLRHEDILPAISVCVDEIVGRGIKAAGFGLGGNHPRFLTAPFRFGGLAGLPFTGRSGMLAFAHHVPEQGAAVILYGPHLGITEDGLPGHVCRVGQSAPSACCGALMDALHELQHRGAAAHPAPPSDSVWEDDYQMEKLLSALAPEADAICSAPHPEIAITETAYGIIERLMFRFLTQTWDHFPSSKVLLAGGILLHFDHEPDLYIDLRRFGMFAPEVPGQCIPITPEG